MNEKNIEQIKCQNSEIYNRMHHEHESTQYAIKETKEISNQKFSNLL